MINFKKSLSILASFIEIVGLIVLSYVVVARSLESFSRLPAFIQDEEIVYVFFSYLLFLLVFIVSFRLYRKVFQYLKRKRGLFITFRLITIAGFLFITPFVLLVLLVEGSFKYDYCGKEFNQQYREALANKNSDVCLSDELYKDLNSVRGFKGGAFCVTPTRKWFELHYKPLVANRYDKMELDVDNAKASCISAIARDLKDVSICEMIRENNLTYSQGFYSILKTGDISGCIYDYASYTKDVELCKTVKQNDNSCRW